MTFTPTLPAGIGARFVRADLQIHTPIDKRFKLPSGADPQTEEGRRKIGQLYVEEAKRLGLTVLGITEHNDLTYYPYIRDAAVGTDVIVFPGVEFTIPPGLHVIALFEPTVNPQAVWDCIVKMGLGTAHDARFHSDDSPKQATKSLKETVALVEQAGGILIAPHVCGKSGLLTLPPGQHRIESWVEPKILAADPGSGRRVATLSEFERGAFENSLAQYKRDYPIATVWTSDARSLDELGKCSTWLKLGRPTIEGLRQAFLDPTSRIKHSEDYSGTTYPRIVSIAWEGSGFLAGQEVRFNENLNCLIGGKGAGKSAVIETLRYALDLPPAPESKEQVRKFVKAVLPAGDTVRVVLETGEPKVRYTIERAYNDPPVVKDANGHILDVEPADLQLPAIYGQKEIYGIALKERDQLSLLDDFVGPDIERLDDEEATCQKDLQRNAGALEDLQDDIAEIDAQLKELPKLQEMKRRYELLGITAKLDRKTRLNANLEKLRRTQKKLLTFAEAIRGHAATKVTTEYGALPDGELLKAQLDEVRAIATELSTSWQATATAFAKRVDENAAVVASVIATSKQTVDAENEACKTVLAELTKAFPGVEVNDYVELEEQIAMLLPLGDDRTEKVAGEKDLQKKRKQHLERLRKIRAERFKARSDTAKRLTESLNANLRLRVAFQGDASAARTYLESLKTGVSKKVLDGLIGHVDFSLPNFVAALAKGPDALMQQYGLSDASGKRIAESIPQSARYELEALRIADVITIEFNVASRDDPQYRPLAALSVGQKSTAILLLLLLNDNRPFVVDQPEDDLDNRFIYEDIVTRLRASKEQRQFVIATHNANIPVLGDAEQIVVLSASSTATQVECCGSIDDIAVQQSVKHILEGGQQAFEMRRKKYGF